MVGGPCSMLYVHRDVPFVLWKDFNETFMEILCSLLPKISRNGCFIPSSKVGYFPKLLFDEVGSYLCSKQASRI